MVALDGAGFLTRAVVDLRSHFRWSDVKENHVSPGAVDRMPLNLAGKTVRWVGYYAVTEHRDTPGTALLREQRDTSAAA